MNKMTMGKTKDRFDLSVLLRLGLFVLLPNLITTPLRLLVEAVIEGKSEAPAFITVPFLIYGFCAEFVVGFGYLVIGYKLPIKNTILRGLVYIMLILFSSYLPNILAMMGGDGEIIEESLTVGIVLVDVISYTLKGLILGLLMKNYDVKNPDKIKKITNSRFIIFSFVNGALFAALNFLTDLLAGACSSSWRLSSILGVTPASEKSFYTIFTIFMFIAGALRQIWNRHCLPEKTSISSSIIFSLEISVFVWLPNVLIMAFFGTPFLLTMAYGIAYTFMIMICVLVYRTMSTFAPYHKEVYSPSVH